MTKSYPIYEFYFQNRFLPHTNYPKLLNKFFPNDPLINFTSQFSSPLIRSTQKHHPPSPLPKPTRQQSVSFPIGLWSGSTENTMQTRVERARVVPTRPRLRNLTRREGEGSGA